MILIEEVLDDFLLTQRVEHHSEATIRFYDGQIRRFLWWLRSTIANPTLADVDASQIRTFILYLQRKDHRWDSDNHQSNKPLSDKSIHAYFRALRAFVNFAFREGYTSENPFTSGRLKAPKVRQVIVPSYTEEEILDLLEACGHSQNGQRDRAIMLLLLDTGIRANELCSLSLQQLEKGRIKILGKGNKERYVMVSPATEKAIRDYVRTERPKPAEYLFVGRGVEPLTDSGLRQLIRRRALQAGVDDSTCHKWRHTFAMVWLEDGGPINALQALLGHSSPVMSMRYAAMASGATAELHRQHSPVERLQKRETRTKRK